MKRKAHRAALSKFQIGLPINSLYNERRNQIAENEPIEQIDSLSGRVIHQYFDFFIDVFLFYYTSYFICIMLYLR